MIYKPTHALAHTHTHRHHHIYTVYTYMQNKGMEETGLQVLGRRIRTIRTIETKNKHYKRNEDESRWEGQNRIEVTNDVLKGKWQIHTIT